MPSPKSPQDDSPDPSTPSPRRPSGAKQRPGQHGPHTPQNRKPSSAGATPKSDPFAATRKVSMGGKKGEPTLLADFLLGRPSAARVAASRKRSAEVAAVKAEMKAGMRQTSVSKLQPPGTVKDRVKAWQKDNAKALQRGDPDEAATEPTEILVQVDDVSVTEEDRVRIKSRKKPRRKKADMATAEAVHPGSEEGSGDEDWEEEEASEAKEPVHDDPRIRSPPKKRIVSDDNWMKRRNKRSPPRQTPTKPKAEAKPASIPKDFLQKTAQNPSVQNKIKDWAMRVDVPETPKTIPRVKKYTTKSGETVMVEEDGTSGRTARTMSGRATEDGVRIRSTKPRSSQDGSVGDGIRIRPVREKEAVNDDGIRVKPAKTQLPDDGIRIRPGREVSADEATVRATSSRRTSVDPSPLIPRARRTQSPSSRTGFTENPDIEPETPTRKSKSRRRARMKTSGTATSYTETQTRTEDASQMSWSDETGSSEGEGSHGGSDRPSTAPANSLADIPFGYSAFSELDLPLGADHHTIKRPKAQRNNSFKAVPKVFKKVVSEGKKIIHDKVDPPKPVVNQPPSIENWLNNTVDPFVDSTSPKKKPTETEWEKGARKGSSSGSQTKSVSPPGKVDEHDNQENADPHDQKKKEEPSKAGSSVTPNSAGLKRSRAVRNTSSPRNASGKKPLREALIDAFRGESSGHKLPPMIYPSGDNDKEHHNDNEYDDEHRESRRRSSGSKKRSPSPEPTLTDSEVSTDLSGGREPMMSGALPKRRPPTTGIHELSTIVSGDSLSTRDSDTVSTLSRTTVTQSTALTGSTDLSRQKSQKSQKSGLKRRLTKHSDLVSVLSLPDGVDVPKRTKSTKATRSLRRKSSKLDNITLDDLLKELADDEQFYQRELKTLVDGVVPVLLTQVVNNKAGASTHLFGPNTADDKADTVGKGVVNMGIALERLKTLHKRAPLHNPQRLLAWLATLYPVYDSYLDHWRLDFQGLIVNLAPAPGKPDDEDSLLNAMDRNEDGDVLDENGERIDVAHLLKRPLVRIKWLLKVLKGALALGLDWPDLPKVIAEYEALQEKARRRHKEETARKTDEDAMNTDTSRCCDLRDLATVEDICIDRTRQVNAKDIFSLDLVHSNGQRLECQVEVIFRDKPNDHSDKGDVLIRELGDGRTTLLFPPIPASSISARKGDEAGVLIAMIRGERDGREWFELLSLLSDNEEQVLDWLDILGTKPIPPPSPRKGASRLSSTTSPKPLSTDLPFGERKLRKAPPASMSPSTLPSQTEEPTKTATPSRYHKRNPSVPSTPTATSPGPGSSPSSEKTPTQSSYLKSSHPLPVIPDKAESRPLRGDVRPSPAKLTKSPPISGQYREDGAPPPPAHRSLGSKSPSVSPPVELAASRVKRRTSSPLKHEYHPSDISSTGSESDGSTSDSESSSDELDEADVPDTMPGISIKQRDPTADSSVLSDNSLTPSDSASKSGQPVRRRSQSDNVNKSIASISYWYNKKGQWRDVWHEACSIVVTPGLIEVHPLNAAHSAQSPGALQSSGTSETGHGDFEAGAVKPLIALDLTPLVMIRQSTSIDLEIRSPIRSYSKLSHLDSGIFRFRSPSPVEGGDLYRLVHQSRMNNAKFKALEEEARFRSFGQQQEPQEGEGDNQSTSSRRRSWFGRRNSYRASTRAPSQSQGSSSSISAPSFLKRLTRDGNLPFDIDKSSVDRQSRTGSGSGGTSLYTSGSSSAGGGTPPRSPSVSLAHSSARTKVLGSDNLKIRCHLMVSASKWEDHGNCNLTITRPPPGMRQELRLYGGMEKRVIVSTIPKKDSEKPVIVLDVVLGSRCFGRLGNRGIILNVWEDLRDENNNVGAVPASGALAGRVKKWCFQCANVAEASWIFGLVAQEVVLF